MSAFPTHMSGWTARRGIVSKRIIGVRRRQCWLAMNKFKLETGKHCNNETSGVVGPPPTRKNMDAPRSLWSQEMPRAYSLKHAGCRAQCPAQPGLGWPRGFRSMACTRPFLSQGPGVRVLVLCNKGCCLPQEAFGLQGYNWSGWAVDMSLRLQKKNGLRGICSWHRSQFWPSLQENATC